MAVFFGKLSDKFPDQIKEGFYRTIRHNMFNGLQPNDTVFAIGAGKIQLWRAKEYSYTGEDKQMNFDIISSNLNISIFQFTFLKYFEITTNLSVLTVRKSPKAFFKINLIGIKEDDLYNEELYHDENNYRTCRFVQSIDMVDDNLKDKDIFLYKDKEWKLFGSGFIDKDLRDKFNDNTKYIGFGQRNKDKSLRLIQSKEIPFSFNYNNYSLLNFYDTFLCNYKVSVLDSINIYPNRIYKLSHGNFSKKQYKSLLDKCLVSVHKDTGAIGTSTIKQGESFIDANVGDYFYLCNGNNSIELIGQFTTEARPSEESLLSDKNWYVRGYTIVAISTKKDEGYKSKLKWWTPNNNSTFIEIKEEDLNLANYKLFKPFFSLSVNKSKTDYQMDQIVKLLELKKQLIIQGAPGTGKTYATAEIALRAIDTADINYSDREEVMSAYQDAVDNKQIVFTTFHQSLDYEEFIEGIKPNNDSDTVTYDIASGIFKNMCKDAVQKDSLKDLQLAIESFKEECINATEKITLETKGKGKFTVTYRGGITFRVRSKNSQAEEGVDFPASIENIEKLYRGENDGMYNKTYVWGILNHLKSKYKLGDYKSDDALDKKYVLIIDEINRGNISKIFGELITLLEADKRIGQKNSVSCKLPYSGDEFGVPDNLYIIGTMNTTDRSLGHIDYAVRRRFGFVTLEADKDKVNDFYASVNVSGNIKDKAVKLFNTISDLITDNCSPEFQYKDIMVGHSYFMAENMDELRLKLDFEIKPLLCEYVKDGLLTLSLDDIKNKIDTLSV